MRPSLQNKINSLKTLAKHTTPNSMAKSSTKMVNDNLSKSIRTERDAKIFRKELSMAFKLAKE